MIYSSIAAKEKKEREKEKWNVSAKMDFFKKKRILKARFFIFYKRSNSKKKNKVNAVW